MLTASRQALVNTMAVHFTGHSGTGGQRQCSLGFRLREHRLNQIHRHGPLKSGGSNLPDLDLQSEIRTGQQAGALPSNSKLQRPRQDQLTLIFLPVSPPASAVSTLSANQVSKTFTWEVTSCQSSDREVSSEGTGTINLLLGQIQGWVQGQIQAPGTQISQKATDIVLRLGRLPTQAERNNALED
ncbi:unnamed protein product [Pleuronectes platessa]|uniref:Uncharacterized protein n=1 Tax=Pleuronectes platessa TaxID=8262 RepID=A0A9N7YFJ8_PLEPL|nr:unnamed protein product [Pleuronectes platessa]